MQALRFTILSPYLTIATFLETSEFKVHLYVL